MTYVITEACIGVKDRACVDVCPVDCISPGPDDGDFHGAEQLYIDPEICIDCAACVDACPVLAIHEDTHLPERWQHYAQLNEKYFSARRSVAKT